MQKDFGSFILSLQNVANSILVRDMGIIELSDGFNYLSFTNTLSDVMYNRLKQTIKFIENLESVPVKAETVIKKVVNLPHKC